MMLLFLPFASAPICGTNMRPVAGSVQRLVQAGTTPVTSMQCA
jgi:hypothetical protein